MTAAQDAAQQYRRQAIRLRMDALVARTTRRPLTARRLEQRARLLEWAADAELRGETMGRLA